MTDLEAQNFHLDCLMEELRSKVYVDPEEINIDESLAVPVIMNAGDASLHHLYTLHKSVPNKTDKFRIGKFLLTMDGLGFIGKQYVMQGLNPTLESKIYNPKSANSSGISHVPSQPVSFPPYRDPGGMLSQKDKPPDIWDCMVYRETFL